VCVCVCVCVCVLLCWEEEMMRSIECRQELEGKGVASEIRCRLEGGVNNTIWAEAEGEEKKEGRREKLE
jgi:hypothetical protein